MDAKTLVGFNYNFNQIYPCPTTQEQEYAFKEACRLVHNANNNLNLGCYDYGKLFVEGKEYGSPEYVAWKRHMKITYDRIVRLYELHPKAVMKHVDEGGIGEGFYLEEYE